MVVDPSEIRIYSPTGARLGSPICTMPTRDVLRLYDPEIDHKNIFGTYLQTLVNAWLQDLAVHWKSQRPPGSDQLEAIGLRSRLEGAETQLEARL